MSHHQHAHTTRTHAGPGKRTTVSNAAVTSNDNDHNGKVAWDEGIRLCAYRKWEAAGKPAGDGVQFWLEAEQELLPNKEATSAHGNSQDADRHNKTRHSHSQK
ncbi:MAG: DUF2934 domain-containing protein [Thermoguttaceae bacterium]|jgi:hypothetical protein